MKFPNIPSFRFCPMFKIEKSEFSKILFLLQTFNLRLKGYFRCKVIYPVMFNVLFFFFEGKIMFHSHDIQIFAFFLNPQFLQFVTLEINVYQQLLFNNFQYILVSIKVKHDQRLVQIMTYISNLFLVQLPKLQASSRLFCDSGKMNL